MNRKSLNKFHTDTYTHSVSVVCDDESLEGTHKVRTQEKGEGYLTK